MKCCICGSEIAREASGYDQGHNAMPIEDGRCCTGCNYTVVLPARLKDHFPGLNEKEALKFAEGIRDELVGNSG